MNKTNLSLGDWVKYDGELWKVRVLYVDCLNVERPNGRTTGLEIVDLTIKVPRYNEIEPIPLTVEILEKNGWRGKSHTQWQFFRDGRDELNILLGKDYTEVEYLNMIYNPEDNAEVNYGHNFEFPRTIYVHELQHIMRLCGIEKEVEV